MFAFLNPFINFVVQLAEFPMSDSIQGRDYLTALWCSSGHQDNNQTIRVKARLGLPCHVLPVG